MTRREYVNPRLIPRRELAEQILEVHAVKSCELGFICTHLGAELRPLWRIADALKAIREKGVDEGLLADLYSAEDDYYAGQEAGE